MLWHGQLVICGVVSCPFAPPLHFISLSVDWKKAHNSHGITALLLSSFLPFLSLWNFKKKKTKIQSWFSHEWFDILSHFSSPIEVAYSFSILSHSFYLLDRQTDRQGDFCLLDVDNRCVLPVRCLLHLQWCYSFFCSS